MADIELDSLVVRDFTEASSEVFKQAVESGEIGENDISLTPFMPANLWIFFPAWADHEIDDMSWLCADTFSWQPSDPYIAGYEKLVNAITGADQKTDTIGDITITYYQKGDRGLKVCVPDQESNLVALYEATGVAWYYLLDQTNKQFKLPRTKWGFTGLRDSVGGYVEPGLPSIEHTHSATIKTVSAWNGTYLTAGATQNGTTDRTFETDVNSAVSKIYGNSDTVQPPATQMHLYFYVGNFEQDAVEQTAGLNAELFNGKADRDLMNTTDNVDFVIESQLPTADNGYTWYRKYKNGWVEQGGFLQATATSDFNTITLPQPMGNANYNAIVTNISPYVAGSGSSHAYVMAKAAVTYNKTATSFGIFSQDGGSGSRYDWVVTGIGAE